ncbi:LysR family transcriptional regulator [Altericroceibacterium spongiae]|uniref:LysR family transcriptional regulator n=1 Tax=Altericroceibacterium spongiae TaxID=2320269 RepID=A0A420EF66_9SPHN|nr:LysR substrate-binding domain-containing protein [Altericroceibacterium spongiae]RKF19310.1 LysR family transcriptional regulator [Altericroceibacterium spongiae]
MDLRQLRHFMAVAETLHFGHAAQRLGMTQPPLSQSIMALERELGADLFLRSKRSVMLTDFGRQWLDHVRPAVEAVDDLGPIAERLRTGKAGRLSLAFVSTADYSVLPDLVQHYSSSFPDVELDLIEATSDVQIEALLEGRINAGILISERSALPSALDYRPLLTEPLVAAVPESWCRGGALDLVDGELQGDAWMAQPLIIFPRRVSPDFHALVTGFYHTQGFQPMIRQEAIQMQTIISLVSAGLGMALVPASLRHLARTGVRYIAIAGDAPMLETGLAWRKGDEAPILAGLIDIAAKAGGDG